MDEFPFRIETDDGIVIGGAVLSADAVVLAAGAVSVVKATLLVFDAAGVAVAQIGRGLPDQPLETVGPRLDAVNPASTPLGLPPQIITATGDGFLEGAVIIWEDKPQATTFSSSTELACRLDPPLVDPDYEPGETVPVQVRNPDGNISGTVYFAWE